MNRLHLYGRVVRVLAVVSLGLGMASVFALLQRLSLIHI